MVDIQAVQSAEDLRRCGPRTATFVTEQMLQLLTDSVQLGVSHKLVLLGARCCSLFFSFLMEFAERHPQLSQEGYVALRAQFPNRGLTRSHSSRRGRPNRFGAKIQTL